MKAARPRVEAQDGVEGVGKVVVVVVVEQQVHLTPPRREALVVPLQPHLSTQITIST